MYQFYPSFVFWNLKALGSNVVLIMVFGALLDLAKLIVYTWELHRTLFDRCHWYLVLTASWSFSSYLLKWIYFDHLHSMLSLLFRLFVYNMALLVPLFLKVSIGLISKTSCFFDYFPIQPTVHASQNSNNAWHLLIPTVSLIWENFQRRFSMISASW